MELLDDWDQRVVTSRLTWDRANIALRVVQVADKDQVRPHSNKCASLTSILINVNINFLKTMIWISHMCSQALFYDLNMTENSKHNQGKTV